MQLAFVTAYRDYFMVLLFWGEVLVAYLKVLTKEEREQLSGERDNNRCN